MQEISQKDCVSGSLSLNYSLFAEPSERRASVVRVAETQARETIHIYGDTQVSERIVWTEFNKYRRDTRQQVDFTTSHILVALPHILSSRPLAFMESKNCIVAKTFLRARYHQEGSSSLGSRVHPLMLCSEVTVRKDEEFLQTYTVFLFCYISFHGWLCPHLFTRTASERLVHSNPCSVHQ